MSSASSPIWRRIARSSFLAYGLLCLIVDAGVLIVTIRHHTAAYHEALALASDDLVREYTEYGGDAEKIAVAMREDSETHGTDNLFLLISDPKDGRAIASASSSRSVLEQMLAHAATLRPRTYRISRECGDSVSHIRVRKTQLNDGMVLSVGYNVTDAEHHVILVAVLLASSLIFALFVGAALGALLARRFTSPLSHIAAAAKRLATGDYSVRVKGSSKDREIIELENAFNNMAAENEKTLSDLRTLTDDIAHDLRTPLTRLRTAAELEAMRTDGAPSQLAVTVSEETSAMLNMINTMLDISQTSSLPSRTPREDVDMVAFVRGVVELYSVVAEEASIRLTLTLPDSPVYFSAHKGRLQQMLGNLLDNAVKFTPSGGEIAVSLRDSPLEISVANTCPGIAPADLPHIFKRFWRAEKSRSLPGNGLGLALVQAIVTSYGGKITCTSVPDDRTTFTINFN